MSATIENVVEEYERGHPISHIALTLRIGETSVLDILRQHKMNSTLPNSFSVGFKQMIAKRDSNDGVTRSSIASELKINSNTVKKACEKFGQALKEKSMSSREFTRIDGVFERSKCPSCQSKEINEVDDDTVYCKKCGDEHVFHDEYIVKVNFEWMEE